MDSLVSCVLDNTPHPSVFVKIYYHKVMLVGKNDDSLQETFLLSSFANCLSSFLEAIYTCFVAMTTITLATPPTHSFVKI